MPSLDHEIREAMRTIAWVDQIIATVGDEVMNHLEKFPGGITFKRYPGDGPQSGYMVSTPNAEKIHRDFSTMGAGDVDAYYNEHPEILKNPHDYYGGWEEERELPEKGSDWYHDVSRNIPDSWDAARSGLDWKQKYIFDNDKRDAHGNALPSAYLEPGAMAQSGPASAMGLTYAKRRRR